MSLTIGSLFSGIGGLELGLEWAGLGPVLWQVENDPFCLAVLEKHWPDAKRWKDVRTVRASQLAKVDLICGGFPCQDVSSAGKRAGLQGEKSGLWWEFVRVVKAAKPACVVVENVASGTSRWLCAVRTHLHQLGYRTRALGIAAADVGAPHLRRRVFIVAHINRGRKLALAKHAKVALASSAHADLAGVSPGGLARPEGDEASPDADRDEVRFEQQREPGRQQGGVRAEGQAELGHAGWRTPQPPMVRMVHGLSGRLDVRARRALGNAVVPQCAEVVGKVVQAWLASTARVAGNDGEGR